MNLSAHTPRLKLKRAFAGLACVLLSATSCLSAAQGKPALRYTEANPANDPAANQPFYNGSARNADFWKRDDARILPTPQAGRITDAAIHQDYLAYEAQQARINATQGNAYASAKAQCWLDVSFQEYTRNDRSSFVEEAFIESKKITDALRAGGSEQPWLLSPLVNKATNKPAPIAALWQRLGALNAQQRSCTPIQAACAEVELIHAGNEWNQGGFVHAKPYLLLADRYTTQVEQANCAPPPPPPAPPPPPPPPAPIVQAPVAPVVVAPPVVIAPPPPPAPKPVLPQRVHFSFDQSYIAPPTVLVLDAIAQALKTNPGLKLQAVGHTDVRATDSYNVKLSMRRVSAVQQYLQAAGILPGQLQLGMPSTGVAGAAGEAIPAMLGSQEKAHQINRRVEFSLAPNSSPAELQAQFKDVQPCGAETQYWCDNPKRKPGQKAPAEVQRKMLQEKALIDALLLKLQAQK
jgi:OmpA-OmpF porin, OOP family